MILANGILTTPKLARIKGNARSEFILSKSTEDALAAELTTVLDEDYPVNLRTIWIPIAGTAIAYFFANTAPIAVAVALAVRVGVADGADGSVTTVLFLSREGLSLAEARRLPVRE